jgi:uncharacterized protein (UPF0332 family)
MSETDNVLRLIGVSMVAIVGLLILFGILLYSFGLIGGPSEGMVSGIDNQVKLNKALNDYQYKLDLVREATQRLDMYYAAKASTQLSEVEFRSWLGTIAALSEEFINRENNATLAGKVYLQYLDLNSGEYDRVIQNEATANSDISNVKQTYNGNAYLYNQQYGATYGKVPYIS